MFVPVEEKKIENLFTTQEKVQQAEKTKADLSFSKVIADEEHSAAEEELRKLKDFQDKQHMEIAKSSSAREVWSRLSHGC